MTSVPATAPATVRVGPAPLTRADVVAIARADARIELTDDAVALMAASRQRIDALAGSGEPVYGVSTGFGALATRHIPPELRAQLQRSLVRSHAAGSGDEVEREVVRAMMALRLHTMATGHTGVRPSTAAAYAAILNAGITPAVREFGSLGCSGDLAPLSHCALALIGEGDVRNAAGEKRTAAEALASAGLEAVELKEKEGLALINGTDGMLGMLLLAVEDLRQLGKAADLAAAMSVEATLGTDRVFAADLQALRPHPGQADSAANLHHRSPAPFVTRSLMPNWSPAGNWPAPSTIRWSPTTAGSSRTATSMAHRWATCSISSPSP
jgi:histidine ammonia-lyase